MKTLLCALLMAGACLADNEPLRHARISIQYIEVPHTALADLLGEGDSGAATHAKTIALTKSGEAKILETSVVICRSGQKATVESVREEIYPTENSPPELPSVIASGFDNSLRYATSPMLRPITAWETKNTGITLEVEPTIGSNNAMVDLRFLPEFVQRLRLETVLEHKDQWGDASLRMPIYEKWRANTSLSLQSGKSELVSVITPEAQPPAPALSRRVLLFVRADVIVSPLKP